MMVLRLCLAMLLLAIAGDSASASPLFAKAIKDKYLVKLPGCPTCHMTGTDPATGEPFGKEVRNDFGKLFSAQLEGKMMVTRMAKAKAALEAQLAAETANDDVSAEKFKLEKKEIDDTLVNDFLEALLKVEPQKHSSGRTYDNILRAGDFQLLKTK